MKLQNLFCAASMLALAACSGNTALEGDNVEYYPVKLEDSKSWSFIDSKGNVYLEDEFSNEPTCVVENHFAVRENDGYTLYEFGKKPKAVKGLEDLKSIGYMDGGLIGIVKPKDRIAFVDASGATKLMLDPIGGKEIVRSFCAFTDGLLLVVTEEGKTGFIDKTGEVVVKPIYDDATIFNEGYAMVAKRKDGDQTIYVINKKGEEVAKVKSNITPGSRFFKDGVMPAYEDYESESTRAGFINTKGEFTKLDKKVKYINDYNSKIIIYRNSDGKYGIMTRDGEEVLRPKYDMMQMIDDNSFLVEKDDKYYIIDKNGDKKGADLEDYDRIYSLSGKGYGLMAREGNTYVMLNHKGERINKEEYEDFGWSKAKNDVLYSDYFNMESFVEAITSLISIDGIGKYKIGTPAEQYVSDPSNYTYTSIFIPDDQPKDGYRYSVEYNISTNESIAGSRYDFYDGSWSYNFNSDSKVNGGTIIARAYTEVWSEAKSRIIEYLKSKGFKVDESSENYVSLKNGDNQVTLGSTNDGEGVNVTLYRSLPTAEVVEEVPEAAAE